MKQQLVIVLPKCMADIPVKIVKDMDSEELVFHIRSSEKESISVERSDPQYAFIYGTGCHLVVSWDEIVWIEADGSYTDIHLKGKRMLKVSFNIAVVEQSLPKSHFVRIHHSCIVNMKHVTAIMGNEIKLDEVDENGEVKFTIGRKYRKEFFSRGKFIGVRRMVKQ